MTWLASVRLTIDYYYYYDIFRYSCLLYIPHFTFILCCYNKYSVSLMCRYSIINLNITLPHGPNYNWKEVVWLSNSLPMMSHIKYHCHLQSHQAADISLLLKRWRIVWVNNTDIAMSWWILRITKQFIIYFLVVFNSLTAPFRFISLKSWNLSNLFGERPGTVETIVIIPCWYAYV